ncbi:protein of unknown function [Nitrosotalea devaniterrae]|uniref:Uncharacterized protein n=1 Tax=Nitrosotalea devaniterrae TaxID=1078905 RepID=A0A128A1A2_9ARCH|nr:protein of unknown function [Candidatus Nitrosotalea devanaterra]
MVCKLGGTRLIGLKFKVQTCKNLKMFNDLMLAWQKTCLI